MFEFDPPSFCGRARLFPLPNLVVFPHAVQVLHVFEPRYRALTEAALGDDRLLALALLAPGWEADYEGRPPLAQIACLCGVVNHHRLDDGRFHLLLAGLHRVRLVRELPPEKLYREAEVELVADELLPGREERRAVQRREILARLRRRAPAGSALGKQLEPLWSDEVSLAVVTDVLGFAFPFAVDVRQALLEEACVDRRAERLLAELGKMEEPNGGERFPPEFSQN